MDYRHGNFHNTDRDHRSVALCLHGQYRRLAFTSVARNVPEQRRLAACDDRRRCTCRLAWCGAGPFAAHSPDVAWQLSDARALADASLSDPSVHVVLPGRVCRAYLDQADADRARGARNGYETARRAELCHRLFCGHAVHCSVRRHCSDDPVCGLANRLHDLAALLHSASACDFRRAGRCAFVDDRAYRRQLYQYCDGQTVLAFKPRRVLRQGKPRWLPWYSASPDAAHHDVPFHTLYG